MNGFVSHQIVLRLAQKEIPFGIRQFDVDEFFGVGDVVFGDGGLGKNKMGCDEQQ